MSKIRFINHENEIERFVSYGRVLEYPNKTIKIIFENELPLDDILCSGFEIINESTDENISDNYYHSYTTIYRRFDDEMTVSLSNDGSVYVEPEIPEYVEPEPYVPTLEEVKNAKISNFSLICSDSIVNGVDVTFSKNNIEHFSYTEEDQVNIKEIFDLAIQTNVPMYYHADGEGCKLYTVEQIIAIYTSATTNKMHHITYFNQIRMYINSLETTDEVEAVEYGQELTGEYLQTYNESMAQAQLVLEALLAKRAAVLSEG
jgi:hypothetical protein